MQQIRTVSIGEVQAFLQNHPGGFLIDVLPPEFHVQQHIPGSSGVCVFETAFQEKMRALVPDMAAPLLVYGAGGSLDSAVAAEKLQREGYTDISLFAGGLEAWRKAGLPLEGEGVDFPVRDESPLPMFKEYMLIPEKSFIRHSDVKQLADYRADATEMLRTTFPAKLLRHIRSKLHEGCSPFRIHFLYARMKDQIASMCL